MFADSMYSLDSVRSERWVQDEASKQYNEMAIDAAARRLKAPKVATLAAYRCVGEGEFWGRWGVQAENDPCGPILPSTS